MAIVVDWYRTCFTGLVVVASLAAARRGTMIFLPGQQNLRFGEDNFGLSVKVQGDFVRIPDKVLSFLRVIYRCAATPFLPQF